MSRSNHFMGNKGAGKAAPAPGMSGTNKVASILLVLMAIVVAFQSPLHPGSRALPDTDSSVYLYAGKLMSEGKKLYVDFFEHKGPLLYLINSLPQRIFGGSFVGVWIIELVFLILDAWLIYKSAKLIVKNDAPAVLTTGVVMYTLGFYFEGGNFTEEYALPFLLTGLYVYLKFLLGDRRTIPVKEIGLVGFCCGLVILLRINMIVLFGTYAFVLFLYFLIHKRWADLGKCIGAFLAGVLIALVPAAVAMGAKGMLPGFIEAYWGYNMDYSVGSNSLGQIASAIYVFWGREVLLPLGVLTGLGCLVAALKRKDETGILVNTSALITLFASLYAVGMSGRTYGHYAIMLLPVFVLPVAYVLKVVFERWPVGHKTAEIAIMTILAAVLISPKDAAGFAINILGTMQPDAGAQVITEVVRQHSDEDGNVIVLGNYCKYYLAADREADTRFFYQNPTLTIREDFRQEFLGDLEENPPQVIIVPEGILPYEDEDVEAFIKAEGYKTEQGIGYTMYYLK